MYAETGLLFPCFQNFSQELQQFEELCKTQKFNASMVLLFYIFLHLLVFVCMLNLSILPSFHFWVCLVCISLIVLRWGLASFLESLSLGFLCSMISSVCLLRKWAKSKKFVFRVSPKLKLKSF